MQIETIWRGILVEAEQSDMGWDWSYKLRLAESDARYEAYVIEQDEITHGVVLIETQWHRSHFFERLPIVYVEYLASAPWNRRSLEDPPSFVDIGKTLLFFTRQRSVELGYGGRVGLHALPDTEAFYHRCGMPDYGPDSDKDELVYFEYSALRVQEGNADE